MKRSALGLLEEESDRNTPLAIIIQSLSRFLWIRLPRKVRIKVGLTILSQKNFPLPRFFHVLKQSILNSRIKLGDGVIRVDINITYLDTIKITPKVLLLNASATPSLDSK